MSLFVGNISKSIGEKDLEGLFSLYGECRVNYKGSYAFIIYTKENSGEEALEAEQGRNLGGRQINIEWSKKSGRYYENKTKRSGKVYRKNHRCYTCGSANHSYWECTKGRKKRYSRSNSRSISRSKSRRRHSRSKSRSKDKYYKKRRSYSRKSRSRSRSRKQSDSLNKRNHVTRKYEKESNSNNNEDKYKEREIREIKNKPLMKELRETNHRGFYSKRELSKSKSNSNRLKRKQSDSPKIEQSSVINLQANENGLVMNNNNNHIQ